MMKIIQYFNAFVVSRKLNFAFAFFVFFEQTQNFSENTKALQENTKALNNYFYFNFYNNYFILEFKSSVMFLFLF